MYRVPPCSLCLSGFFPVKANFRLIRLSHVREHWIVTVKRQRICNTFPGLFSVEQSIKSTESYEMDGLFHQGMTNVGKRGNLRQGRHL